MQVQKYVAELLATFSLAFAVSASIVNDLPIATPFIAALTLCLFVYTIGGVSGAHLNPAITIALATIKKISPMEAVIYVASQCIGAVLALQACLVMFGNEPGAVMTGGINIGVAEAIGAFFLAFGVAFAVHRGTENNNGIVVGGSLLLGILVAAGVSNGVLNPAVALAVGGIDTVSLTYTFAPIVGAIVAMWLYVYIIDECPCGGKKKK